jgi:hypothetical protein
MFINEIVWCYNGGGNTPSFMPRKHDTIYFYGFNSLYSEQYVPYVDLHDYRKNQERGKILQDWWIDVPSNQTITTQTLIYPTAKPYKLLERIICLSTK